MSLRCVFGAHDWDEGWHRVWNGFLYDEIYARHCRRCGRAERYIGWAISPETVQDWRAEPRLDRAPLPKARVR